MTVNLEQNDTVNFEQWLTFGLEKFNPGWRESWGKTIVSNELREAIAETPRMATKIQQQILDEIRNRIFSDTPANETFPFPDVNVLSVFIEKANRQMCTRVGLVWNANTIKSLLNGDDSHALVEMLGADAIKYTLQFCETAPPAKTDIKIRDLKTQVENDGLLCCINWVKQFPEDVAVRLAALLPPPDHHAISGDTDNDMIKTVNLVLNS